MAATTSQLSFIIVNWNGGDLLRHCIESVAKYPPSTSCNVVVVDNASTDGSLTWLQSGEAQTCLGTIKLELIVNSKNLGFGRANNQAFAYTKSPLLFLLNPDAELTPGACDTLISTLLSSERAAACGPRLLNADGSLQHSVWRNPPTASEIIVSGLGLWRLLPRRLRGEWLLGGHWNHDRRRAVPLLIGAAMLVRREVVEAVGGFDEGFHMYGRGYEWCLRMIRAGWELIFEPDASVIHQGSHFSLQRWTNLEKLRVQMDAGVKYDRYCLTRSQRLAKLLATCLVSFVQKSWYQLRGRPADVPRIIWDANLAELKHSLTRAPEVSE